MPIRVIGPNFGNETCAPIANPPNTAQLGGTTYHSPTLYPATCSIVGMRPGTDTQHTLRQTHKQTDRHTDGRHHYTFCLAMPDAKCNQSINQSMVISFRSVTAESVMT